MVRAVRFHLPLLLAALGGCAFDDHRRAELCADSTDCPVGRCVEGLCVPGEPSPDVGPDAQGRLDAALDAAPDLEPPTDLAPVTDRAVPVDQALDLAPPPDADPAPDVGTDLPPEGDGPVGCARNPLERCWRVLEDVALSHPDLPGPAPDASAATLRVGLPATDRWRDAFLKFDRAPFLAGKRPETCALLLRRAPGPAGAHQMEVRAIAGNFSAENLAAGAPVPMNLAQVARATFILGGPESDSLADVTAQVLAGFRQPRQAGIALRVALDRFALNADALIHSGESEPEFAQVPPRLRCSYQP